MSVLFVVIVGIGFPILAVRSHRLLERGAPFPPRRVFLVQTLVLLLTVGALAVATAHIEEIELFPAPADLGLIAVGASVGLVLTSSVVPIAWRVASARQKERLSRVLPKTRNEWLLYVGVALAAGIAEEMAYRAVLYEVLHRWTGSGVVAVALAVASFAIAHAVQGGAGVAAVAGLGLGFHALVFLTGSLYAAMAVHAAHDLIAGIWYRRLLNREAPKSLSGNHDEPLAPRPRID